MYELYKNNKWYKLIVGGFFSIPVIAFPYGAYKDFEINGFSVNTILFTVMTLIFLFLVIMIMLPSDPYYIIKKWQQTDPELVKEMENDFLNATEYSYNIWKGQKFYFFKDANFFVVPIGQFKSISIRKGWRKAIGTFYKAEFVSDKGSAKIDTSFLIQRPEKTIEAVTRMAYESGIILDANYD